MPRYFYTAKSLKGESKSGTMETKDVHELSRLLRQEGYILVSANSEEAAEKKRFKVSPLFTFGVSLKEKMFFTRNLKIMIGAGLPLPRALKTLAEQSKNRKFKNALKSIQEELMRGKSFSQALSSHSDVFSELFQNMIKVGEEAGTLEEVLKVLTEQMEREYELKSKIMGALLYPAVIVSAMVAIGILMLVMVVPKLAETFVELKIDLPATTKFVIFSGNFLSQRWYFGILIIIVFLILFRRGLKTKGGKKTIDILSLKIPIISSIITKINAAYTTRTLGSLIASGVPIVRSLEIVSRALGNSFFREAMAQAAEKVKKGEKLGDALKPFQNLYPSLVVQMVEVGEETGETASMLTKLADFYEEEVTATTKNLAAVIEPILMLVVGAVVGFFAISMIQPMYSMLGAIE